jgi:hypothetical protein
MEIELDRAKGEIVSFIQVGFGEDHAISYFHLVSSEGREHKWGSAEGTVRIDQKYIKGYESCFLRVRTTLID